MKQKSMVSSHLPLFCYSNKNIFTARLVLQHRNFLFVFPLTLPTMLLIGVWLIDLQVSILTHTQTYFSVSDEFAGQFHWGTWQMQSVCSMQLTLVPKNNLVNKVQFLVLSTQCNLAVFVSNPLKKGMDTWVEIKDKSYLTINDLAIPLVMTTFWK